jgi:ABC-2 type transport system permease protein
MNATFWRLCAAEWERLWCRKLTWLIFAAIPVLLVFAGRYYVKQNATLPTTSPEYTVVANFPVMSLSEHLMTVFNLIVVVLLVVMVTEEYRSGQLRMVMQRAISFGQLFWAKWLVLLAAVCVFVGVYFVGSHVVGFVLFDNPPTSALFYHDGMVSGGEAFSYNIRYYMLAAASLVAISSVMLFIAVIAQTVTTAVGGGLAFLLVSFGYPFLVHMFGQGLQPPLLVKWQFLSLTQIQYEGIAVMLAEHPHLVGWNAAVLAGYTVVFAAGAYLWFVKRDRFV